MDGDQHDPQPHTWSAKAHLQPAAPRPDRAFGQKHARINGHDLPGQTSVTGKDKKDKKEKKRKKEREAMFALFLVYCTVCATCLVQTARRRDSKKVSRGALSSYDDRPPSLWSLLGGGGSSSAAGAPLQCLRFVARGRCVGWIGAFFTRSGVPGVGTVPVAVWRRSPCSRPSTSRAS